jgi:formylglycine-generating enzyme required for sulfatase activity
MPRIFISYSRRDEAFARKLATSLSQMGADIWIDVEDIPAGMKWSSAIQEGLDSGNLLIVIISPDSMASRNVEDEWQYYLDNHKPVIPVLLHPSKIHFQLSRIQYIDFHNQNYDVALRQLYIELDRKGVRLTPNMPDPAKAYLPTPHQYPPAPAPGRGRNMPVIGLLLAGIGVLGALVVIGGIFILNNLSQTTATPPPATIQQTIPTATQPDAPTATPLVVTAIPLGFPGNPVTRNADWTPRTATFSSVEMSLVPAGCFMMGSSEPQIDTSLYQCQAAFATCERSLFEDERSQARVCFEEPFWIDRFEVSNAAYGSSGNFPGDSNPRTNITWYEAQTHCQARGARLPTEAEWEYAARGVDSLVYPWGNDFDGTRLNYCDRNCQYTNWWDTSYTDGYAEVAPVTAYSNGASWVGALNMSGNVWEWTSTIYRDYPYSETDGRENNADINAKRTLRGGSWNWIAADTHTSARADYAGDYVSSDWYGFRCARDWQQGDINP